MITANIKMYRQSKVALRVGVSTAAVFVFVYLGGSLAARAERSSTGMLAGGMRYEAALYEYDEDDPPETFFFPKEKARWDGYKVTMTEWYMLTDLQKEKFISEYIEELKKQYNSAIDVMGLDYLRALNLFSYYSNDMILNEPSTKFVDKLLAGQGKIEERNEKSRA